MTSRLGTILFLVCLAIGSALATTHAVPPDAPTPRVSISPIIPPGADDGLDQGLAFAELLAVHLSGDPRWALVERTALPLVEQEWALKSSRTAGRAEALRVGALARADLFLECRVSSPAEEHPWCRIAAIETTRAEVLAEKEIKLQGRPVGSWYRSPPDRDLGVLAEAAAQVLADAGARLAERRGRPVIALLFSPPEEEAGAGTGTAALTRLAEQLRAAGCHWVNLVPGAAAESEGLLHLLGYTDASPSPWEVAADVYLWIHTKPDGAPTLRSWRPGQPVRDQAWPIDVTADEGAAAGAILASLDLPRAPPDAAERLAVARDFLRQARERWSAAGLEETRDPFWEFGLRKKPSEAELKALQPIHTLLAAAAFFALEDEEIQELRALLDVALVPYPGAIMMMQRYCAVADRFWVRADGSVDWRLCADSFAQEFYLPVRFRKRRMATVAEALSKLPEEVWKPFGPLMESWLQTLLDNPEHGDLELFKKIWPMVVAAMGQEVRTAHRSGKIDLYTAMRMGPEDWRGELHELISAAGPALFRPPPTRRFNALNAPTERRGLSVRNREPRVISKSYTKIGADQWSLTEKLDNGGVRQTTTDVPPPTYSATQPPQTIPSAAHGSASRITQAPIIEAANRRDWAEVKRLLEGGVDLASTENPGSPMGTTVGQVLLQSVIRGSQVGLAERLLDLGVKPQEKYASVFGSLWVRLGEMDEAEFRLYRRLSAAGARIELDDFRDPFIRLLENQKRERDFAREVDELRRRSGGRSRNGGNELREQINTERETKALRALQQLLDLHLTDIFGRPAMDRPDEDGVTPLTRVILMEWKEGLRALLLAGADLDRGHFEGTSTRRLLARNPDLARFAADVVAGTSATPSMPSSIPEPEAGTPTPASDGETLVAALLRNDSVTLEHATLTDPVLRYRDGKNWSLLHHALNERNEPFANRLIAAGAPLNVLSTAGQSPLAFAAAMRLEPVVETLLAAGADVNLRGGDAPSPLFQAAFSQNPSLVRRLLAAGADITVRAEDDQRTAVHAAACRADNVAVLEVLFSAGADFHAVTPDGDTALDWALSAGASENVPYLHSKGVGWRKRSPDALSPLQMAARHGTDRMVRALLECGLWDENALHYARTPAVRILLEDAALRRGSKIVEDIALWQAICADRENGVRRAEAYLAEGGNINPAGEHPLDMALRAMNPALVRFLISRGAVARVRISSSPSAAQSTLWCVLAPSWLNSPSGSKPPINTTLEKWDAYAAEMITLIAPRWPAPDYAELMTWMEHGNQPLSVAAFRAAGVKPASKKALGLDD